MSVRKRYKADGSFVWEFCITISKHPRKQYRKSGFKKEQIKTKRILKTDLNFQNTVQLVKNTLITRKQSNGGT